MKNSSYLDQKGLDRKRVNILKRSVPPVIKVSDRRTLIVRAIVFVFSLNSMLERAFPTALSIPDGRRSIHCSRTAACNAA